MFFESIRMNDMSILTAPEKEHFQGRDVFMYGVIKQSSLFVFRVFLLTQA